MKDYTEIFKNTYASVIKENKKQNKKKYIKILIKKILLGVAMTITLIIALIILSLVKEQESWEHIHNIRWENVLIIIPSILGVNIIIGIALTAFTTGFITDVNEKLEKASQEFAKDQIIKDILSIIYKKFPPLIQSNTEDKIDINGILKTLTPRVSVDNKGNLSIYDINLDYREPNQSLCYKDGESKYYLTNIK